MNICLKCNRPAASHTINNIRGGQFDSHDPLTREDQYGTANTMLTVRRAATETIRELMNVYNESRNAWIGKFGSDEGFNQWFTKQVGVLND